MRAVRVFITLAALILIFVHPVFASTQYSADDFDLDAVLDSLGDDVRSRLPEKVFESEGFAERFSFEYFFSLLCESVALALSPTLKSFAGVLGLIIIASVLSALKDAVGTSSLAVPFEIASGLCIMLTLYKSAVGVVRTVEVYLAQLSNTVNAMVPVTVAIGSAGGNISSSSVSASAMLLGLSVVETLTKEALYPIVQFCFGLVAASGAGKVPGLDSISKTVRGMFTWGLGLVSAIISAVMTFQTSIASRADSLSMRALKFTASKSVPVVGGVASDAVGAVAESLALVKSTVGWTGVIIIGVMTLPVVANILLMRLGIMAASMSAQVLGLEREHRILEEIVGLYASLAAICVIAALMFIYALAVFAKSAIAMK